MASRKPRMSLPPELGEIDDAWGQDEQPTIARPSRIPTSPQRIEIPSEFPTAPGVDPPTKPGLEAPVPTGLELDLADSEEEADLQERVTSVPEIPLDEFARTAMRSDSAAATTDAPPPDSELTQAPPEPSGLSTRVPDSKIPTAPPPEEVAAIGTEVDLRTSGHIPPVGAPGITLGKLDSDVAPPPLSEPRKDPSFSGRFSSAPPDASAGSQKMKDRFAMGDFSGALEIAEKILNEHPNDGEAESLAKKCREVLEDMYSSRISGLERVPGIIMGPDQIRWLSLDHRAGFLLSMIDGASSIDDLLDISGMQRLDALRIICELLDQKVIALT